MKNIKKIQLGYKLCSCDYNEISSFVFEFVGHQTTAYVYCGHTSKM